MLSLLSSPASGRGAGTGLSAVLHLAAVALLVFGLPDLPRPSEAESAIPVTFVPAPPPDAPQDLARPDPAIQPEKAETPPAEPPLRPRPVLEDIRPEAPDEAAPPSPQETARIEEPADGAERSDEKSALLGRWRLEPLTLRRTGHPCGDASASGSLDLIGERGPGAYHGTLKTWVRWTRCPPQVASYYVELRVKDGGVVMVGAGFADRGTLEGDVMRLKDAYGTSVWRRQKGAAPAGRAK